MFSFANGQFGVLKSRGLIVSNEQLLPIVEAVRVVTGKQFHAVTVRRWRRENRLRDCVRVGKEWFCAPDRVREMIARETKEAANLSKP